MTNPDDLDPRNTASLFRFEKKNPSVCNYSMTCSSSSVISDARSVFKRVVAPWRLMQSGQSVKNYLRDAGRHALARRVSLTDRLLDDQANSARAVQYCKRK